PAPWLDAAKLEEQRQRLPESSFRRLFLNEWTAAEDRLADPDDLRACVTLDGPWPPEAGLRYVVGLDVGLSHDRPRPSDRATARRRAPRHSAAPPPAATARPASHTRAGHPGRRAGPRPPSTRSRTAAGSSTPASAAAAPPASPRQATAP